MDSSQQSDPTAEITAEAGESGADARTQLVGEPRREIEDLKRGSTIGRYVVLGRLGEGGMGVVYSAYDPELDRKVAVKVLRPEDRIGADGSIARTRFLREAQSMAKLSHGNVAAVYDVGTLDERVFIAMEFVEGVTLRRWIEREIRADEDVDVDWKRVVAVFVQAGRGLIAAHQAGIIHRDFKPENVMVDGRGRAVVLDFGLARPTGDYNSRDSVDTVPASSGSFDSSLTSTGTVMGTPNYMAPEQHRGSAVDERTDQFAFCVALYEALWGRRPFAGRNARELASNVVGGRLKSPPKSRVPSRIEKAVLQGLQTAPASRHPTMQDLLRALARPRSRRSTLLVAGGLALVVATAAGSVIVSREPSPCEGAAAPIEAAWDKGKRAAVHDAFVPHAKADGEATFERVKPVLDDWTVQWRAARTDACEAARVRGEQSEDVLELRYACLDRQLRRFDAMVGVLAGADDAIVFGAVKLAAELPPASDCADIDRLRKRVAPPADPVRRAEVEAIRDRIATVNAWGDAGDLARVEPEVELLLVRAHDVEHPPVLAEVFLTKARLYVFTARVDEGLELAEQALLIGLATGHHEVTFEALLVQAHTEGRYRDGFAAAHVALRRAAAVLEHIGGDPRLQTSMHIVEARVLSSEDRDEESVAKYEVVLAALRELDEERTPTGIGARTAYGTLLLDLDRHDEAKKVLDEAITLGREALGSRHPEVAAGLIYRGRALTMAGDHEAALASTREAKDMFVAAYGEEHLNVVAVLNSEALVLDHMGRYDEAVEVLRRAEAASRKLSGETRSLATIMQNLGSLYTRSGEPQRAVEKLGNAIAIVERVHGSEDESVAYLGDLLGEAQLATGDVDGATAALERSQKIFAKKHGDDDPLIGRPLVGLGEAALLRGDDEEARRHFVRVLALVDANDEEKAVARARANFGLAQVLARSGQREQALSLAREAETALTADKSDPARLEAVTAWLRAQG